MVQVQYVGRRPSRPRGGHASKNCSAAPRHHCVGGHLRLAGHRPLRIPLPPVTCGSSPGCQPRFSSPCSQMPGPSGASLFFFLSEDRVASASVSGIFLVDRASFLDDAMSRDVAGTTSSPALRFLVRASVSSTDSYLFWQRRRRVRTVPQRRPSSPFSTSWRWWRAAEGSSPWERRLLSCSSLSRAALNESQVRARERPFDRGRQARGSWLL